MRAARLAGIGAAVVLMAGLGIAFAATPDTYTPPCTANTDSCRQKRIVALENHYKSHNHPSPSPSVTPSSTPTATPTPTPTPTATVTPTPTPTSTSSPSRTCTAPVFTTTSSNNVGDGRTFDGPGGPYFVHNNMWNNHSGAGPVGTYTMNVCSFDNWFEVARQQPSTVSPGAVRAYPNVHKDYNDAPLSSVYSARFAHNTSQVPGMIWNVAFDVWINDSFDNELMIWTENLGQRPAGSMVASSVTIGGKAYQLWRSGSGTGGIFTYVSIEPQRSGIMPLSAFFTDLQTRGWLEPRSGGGPDTTWQVDYGVEVVSTNGVDHRFNFNDFEMFDASHPS